MLDLSNATDIEELWSDLTSQAVLPMSEEEFFAKSGAKLGRDERVYERHYLRCQAIMKCACDMHAIYMKDCSRTGMGLVSPVQLFPRERIQIWMNPGRSYLLETVRCQRIRANCYVCGTIFILK